MAFKSGRTQIKMSEETFDFVCTTCAEDDNKTLEAVRYCVECKRYCCVSCTDAHKFPALRSHNLLEVNQGQQASGQSARLPEFPTERCRKHTGKVLDMYCEGHDAIGCYVCIAKDHKTCQDNHIHSIPDMIDTIFNLADCKQTQKLLKDMMVSMETVSKSKDTKLETLTKAKKEALDQVSIFQKALEALVRKAAESSRQEVETAYKELETELKTDQRNIDVVHEDLKSIDDKLTQSEGNRAQRFACTKLADEVMKEAESKKMGQDLHRNTDTPITFTPDQPLLEYVKSLQGIGQVQKHRNQKHNIYPKQKTYLYKVKGSRDISIKLSDDSNTSNAFGCCLTPDYKLLVTDYNNKKLKRIDIQTLSVVDYCTLDSAPYGICCISKHEVAVACQRNNKIQFVSIQCKMSPTRQIKMSHACYGIAFNDGKLFVTDHATSLLMYDMSGTLLKTVTQDNAGNKLFSLNRHITFNERGNRMYVGDGNNGVKCFDDMGNYLSTITDTDVRFVDGVCIDGRGNVFMLGYHSHNVVQFSEQGKKVGVVVKQGDGLQYPRSACFHQGLNRMFVTMSGSDVVKMYELE